jgi:hypothetical protein
VIKIIRSIKEDKLNKNAIFSLSSSLGLTAQHENKHGNAVIRVFKEKA